MRFADALNPPLPFALPKLPSPNQARRAVLGLRAFLRLVANPDRLEEVFSLRDQLDGEGSHELADLVERLKEQPAVARAFRAGRRLPPLELAELRALPEGTLGREFARRMDAAGLDPAAIPHLEARNETSWFTAHLYETHDLWHALTGFGTDVAGELGLQAFYLAQLQGPLPVVILAAGMLNTLVKAMDDAPRRMEAITAGWQRGRAAAPLLAVDWQQALHEPLADLRQRLGVVPVAA